MSVGGLSKEQWFELLVTQPDGFNELRELNQARLDLRGVDLRGKDISRASWLAPADLSGADLRDARLPVVVTHCRLEKTNLAGASFALGERETAEQVQLLWNGDFATFQARRSRFVSLVCTDLSGIALKGANLECVSFGRANLEGALFEDCDLTDVRFGGARLQAARFVRCRIYRTSYDEADLRSAAFVDLKASATFHETNLDRCKLDGVRHERSLFGSTSIQGTSFVNCEFRNVKFTAAVGDANFSGARFDPSCEMNYCDLRGSVFDGATLSGVSFRSTNLDGVSLRNLTGPVELGKSIGRPIR